MTPLALFVCLATLLALAGVAWIVVPLVRHSPQRPDVDRFRTNLAILQDQLRDLEAEHVRGNVSAALYAQTRAELERRVLEETQGGVATTSVAEAPQAPAPRRTRGRNGMPAAAESEPAAAAGRTPAARWTALGVAVLIPLAAALIYWQRGAPAAFDPPEAVSADAHTFTPQQIDEMVGKLAQRLEQQPDDSRGWSILARSYYAMQRYPDAAHAYERLLALEPRNPDVLADYADALGVTQDRKLSGRPLELIQRALQIDPKHWKALALAGTEAFDRKDYPAAVQFWERVKKDAPDSPIAQSIDASIAEARELGGLAAVAATLQPAAGASAMDAAATSSAAVAKAPVPSPAAGSNAANPPAVAGASIDGTVKLDPKLASQASPTDVVFIFARHAQGPRMPLAIRRIQVKDLPARFTLDDSLAMSPEFRLSTAQSVIVGARISKTGQAIAASGDLEGKAGPLPVGSHGIEITIDAVVR